MDSSVKFDATTHVYRDDSGIRKPSVTWILAKSGLCSFDFLEDEIRERAMARGRSVHWMTRLEDEGVLNYRTVPRALRPYRKAYLAWKRGVGFQPEMIEEPFISRYGFAGTPDRVGRLMPTEMFPRGSRAVIDLKTGPVADWTRLQLCFYAVGVSKTLFEAKSLRRIGLSLRSDGSYKVREFYRDTWDVDWAVCAEAKRRTEKSWATNSRA